jgi:glycosyltransferase involved in cell wall biosynthesis
MIPDIGISNGIMSVILNYAKVMPDDIKFDVVYFAEKEQTKQAEIEALGGRVFKINAPSPKTALTGEMGNFFNAHKGEWQVLHINAPHFTMFIAPQAKRAGIKKICCHCHSTLFSLNPNNLKRNELLNKPTEHLVDKKFACSKVAGDYWYKGEYEILNNAIDCAKYAFNQEIRNSVRNSLNLNNKLVIGHIGRTDVIQKNHLFLLKVFAQIAKQNPNAQLLLIGANKTDETTKLCNELKITDKVDFLGLRNDVNALLQAVDVFIFPSTNEGLPVSIIEAQASGLPVLMSNSVTNEVCVTDCVYSLSLDEGAEIWANKAIELSKLDRKNTLKTMQSAGWDIFDASQKLVEYYRG